MKPLMLNADRKPFSIADLSDRRLLPPHEADLALLDSHRRQADANSNVVEKAGRSVAELFTNWQQHWCRSFGSWARPELRLLVGQRTDIDIQSGTERVFQDWFVVTSYDQVLAWLTPVGGTDNPDSRPVEKLAAIAPDLPAELAEPKRYFVGMDAPSRAKAKWVLPPYLDMPGSGAHFPSAVKQLCGKALLLDSVFERIGTDKLRCYMVTSNGEFVLFVEGVRNSELYVVNIADLRSVLTLADPLKEIDAYVSSVIDHVIEFQP